MKHYAERCAVCITLPEWKIGYRILISYNPSITGYRKMEFYDPISKCTLFVS